MKNELENTIQNIINGKSRIFKNTESFFVYLKWLWINTNEVKIEKNRIYLWDKTKIWIIKPTNWTVRFLPLYFEKLDIITQSIANELVENFEKVIKLPDELLEGLDYQWIEINIQWKNTNKWKIICIWNPSQNIISKLLDVINEQKSEMLIDDSKTKNPTKIKTHLEVKNKTIPKISKKSIHKKSQKKRYYKSTKRILKKWK